MKFVTTSIMKNKLVVYLLVGLAATLGLMAFTPVPDKMPESSKYIVNWGSDSHRVVRFVEHQPNNGVFELKIEAGGDITWRKEVVLYRVLENGNVEEYAVLHTQDGQTFQLAKFTRDQLGKQLLIRVKYASLFFGVMTYYSIDFNDALNPDDVMGTRVIYKWERD